MVRNHADHPYRFGGAERGDKAGGQSNACADERCRLNLSNQPTMLAKHCAEVALEPGRAGQYQGSRADQLSGLTWPVLTAYNSVRTGNKRTRRWKMAKIHLAKKRNENSQRDFDVPVCRPALYMGGHGFELTEKLDDVTCKSCQMNGSFIRELHAQRRYDQSLAVVNEIIGGEYTGTKTQRYDLELLIAEYASKISAIDSRMKELQGEYSVIHKKNNAVKHALTQGPQVA